MKKILILLAISAIIIGNNNYQELSKIAIITNIGIEENNNSYRVIFQEIVPKKEENKINNDLKYYKAQGSNINECFKKINENIPKKMYFEHLENIVIKSNNYKLITKLNKYLPTDLDNFNIVYTNSSLEKVLKYHNNYNYINSIIDEKLTYRKAKINTLEKRNIKVPIIKFSDNNLLFYKYKVLENNL